MSQLSKYVFRCYLSRSAGLLILAVACLRATGLNAQDHLTDQPLETAENYMNSVGGKLEFYFTKEFPPPVYPRTPENPNYSAFWVPRYREDRREIASVDELVVHLRKTLIDITVLRNPQHPKVIHLVDNALKKEKRYPLDERLTICFTGVLADLPDAIGQCVPRVRSMRGGDGRRSSNDWLSEIECRVCQPQTVRQILTDAVPQPCAKRPASRILWESLYQGTPASFEVRFPLPETENDPLNTGSGKGVRNQIVGELVRAGWPCTSRRSNHGRCHFYEELLLVK